MTKRSIAEIKMRVSPVSAGTYSLFKTWVKMVDHNTKIEKLSSLGRWDKRNSKIHFYYKIQ